MTDCILKVLKEQGSEKKENVVRAAAKIIKEKIRETILTKLSIPTLTRSG